MYETISDSAPQRPPINGPNSAEHKNTLKNLNETLIPTPTLKEKVPRINDIAISIATIHSFFVE